MEEAVQLPEGPPKRRCPLAWRRSRSGGAPRFLEEHSKRRQHPPKATKGGQIRPGVALIRQLEVELGPL